MRFSYQLTVFREKGDPLSTVFVHAEYQEQPSSAGPPTREWVLTGTAEDSQLGTKQRVREKEEIQEKVMRSGMHKHFIVLVTLYLFSQISEASCSVV